MNALVPILCREHACLGDHLRAVLVADDLIAPFLQAARTWLEPRGASVELTDEPHAGFHRVQGSGRDWGPRLYVALITDLLQGGLTRCLVGTRGLLGEGWDATKL